MPVGVEEIDRLENAVMRRPQHIDAVRGQMRLGRHQFVIAADLQGKMLDPGGGGFIAAHRGLVGQFEKGQNIAAARIEKDVRSEESRGGKECVSTCRSRWWR